MNSKELIELSCKCAKEGVAKGEGGPFGAIIVDASGNIVSMGNNRVLVDKDPTAHAEMVAIRRASQKINSNDLSGLTIYSSCEPCPMCLSAIIWANIKTVYYASTRNDAAKIGFRDKDIYDYIKGINKTMIESKHIHNIKASQLFKEYKEENKEIY